jgi:hypothetical protein
LRKHLPDISGRSGGFGGGPRSGIPLGNQTSSSDHLKPRKTTNKAALIGGVVAVALLAAPAAAQGWPMVLGEGAHDGGCGEWAGAPMGAVDLTYRAWVLGFVTGANTFAAQFPTDITRSLPNDSVLLWAKNWCRDHPMAKVWESTLALLLYLQGSASPSAVQGVPDISIQPRRR